MQKLNIEYNNSIFIFLYNNKENIRIKRDKFIVLFKRKSRKR